MELERREEALAAVKEAVNVRDDLARARPDTFLVGLVQSLHNLAIILTALGRTKEASTAQATAQHLASHIANDER